MSDLTKLSWSVPETAEFLHYSTDYVRELIHRGILEATKVGSRWRVYVESIKDFADL